jgi:hypothetical protein
VRELPRGTLRFLFTDIEDDALVVDDALRLVLDCLD